MKISLALIFHGSNSFSGDPIKFWSVFNKDLPPAAISIQDTTQNSLAFICVYWCNCARWWDGSLIRIRNGSILGSEKFKNFNKKNASKIFRLKFDILLLQNQSSSFWIKFIQRQIAILLHFHFVWNFFFVIQFVIIYNDLQSVLKYLPPRIIFEYTVVINAVGFL